MQKMKCPVCDGYGSTGQNTNECRKCHGTGEIDD